MISSVERIMVMTVFLVFVLSLPVPFEVHSAVIIDHTCTDISQVPEYWVTQGKELFRISYGHTSHGSQIVTGMNIVNNLYGSLYDFNYSGSAGVLSFHDYEPSGDLGNPDRTTWAQRTRDLLNAPGNDRNLIMWSWCGQADTTPENIQIYLDLMSGLEADYPDVTFIYMTGHLNGTGEAGDLHQRNNQIRSHVISNNGVLFDFADIESYDPEGSYFLDRGADDGCNYSGGNWADQWCDANPGHDLCTTCSCAHSKPLNCNLKGRAFWWMMARLSGWNTGSTTSTTTSVDPDDTDSDSVADSEDNCLEVPNGPSLGTCTKGSVGSTCVADAACGVDGICSMDQEDSSPPGGNSCGDACECEGNFDDDDNQDGSDAAIFKVDFGRDIYNNPCSSSEPCNGNFDCDDNVDGSDAAKFKEDFGRDSYNAPCPSCLSDPWCITYQ